VAEQSRASLVRNRFGDNPLFDIDTGCGKQIRGYAEVQPDNTFDGPRRSRSCPE
jgi:hypothetical protein